MFDELAGEQRSLRERIERFFSRPSNPKTLRIFAIGFILLLAFGGIAVLSQSPLFHSVSGTCSLSTFGCDPSTYVWYQGQAPGFLTNGKVSSGSCILATSCFGMQATPTSPAIALSATSFSIAQTNGKDLGLYFSIVMNETNDQSQGLFFLTINGTLPTETSYSPFTDPNVILVERMFRSLTGNTTVFHLTTFINHKVSQDTILNENTGCGIASSSCYLDLTQNLCAGSCGGAQFSRPMFNILNFTGGNPGGTCTNGFANVVGPNCSFDTIVNYQSTSQQILPVLETTESVYAGLWMGPNNTNGVANIGFLTDAQYPTNGYTQFQQLNVQIFTPTPATSNPPPTIDTGGFFGPIIRALIAIGVFIVQNIINFLSFLAGLLWPTLTGVFTVLANALKLVLNSVGNFFGLGNVGDLVISFFTGVVNFLSNIVVSAFGQILNVVNLFVQLLTWLGSIFGGPIWTGIIGIATLIASGWTTIVTAYGFLTRLSTTSLLGINYYFLIDWIFGMFMLSTKGMEGFKTWIDLNGLVFSKLAMAMFFFVKESVQVLVWIKQIVVNWV